MNLNFLEFEQPIAELEAKLEELRYVGSDAEINISDEISKLQEKSKTLTESIFANLTPWQISQLARHPQRPYTLDYVQHIFTDFEELHGDRVFADDRDDGGSDETAGATRYEPLVEPGVCAVWRHVVRFLA